jgi:hypothetical protein
LASATQLDPSTPPPADAAVAAIDARHCPLMDRFKIGFLQDPGAPRVRSGGGSSAATGGAFSPATGVLRIPPGASPRGYTVPSPPAGFADRLTDKAKLLVMSVSLNQRLRLKTFLADDELPSVDSVNDLWNAANWFEREAFDLYGIVFEGHPDLRRILTDYGFIGHPFRKDFPTSGHVEMRYDAERQRVIYQPVTIEPREITPRIIREDNYGGLQ